MSLCYKEPKLPAHTMRNSSILALIGLLPLVCAAQGEIPIRFEKGAVRAQVTGELSSMQQEIRYVLSARSGQHMKITVDAPGPVRGTVSYPNGDYSGSPGDAIFDDFLPLSGNYRIALRESPMGEEWKGQFKLFVEIR